VPYISKTNEFIFYLLEFLECIDKLKIRFLTVLALVVSSKLQSSIFIILLYYLVMLCTNASLLQATETKLVLLKRL